MLTFQGPILWPLLEASGSCKEYLGESGSSLAVCWHSYIPSSMESPVNAAWEAGRETFISFFSPYALSLSCPCNWAVQRDPSGLRLRLFSALSDSETCPRVTLLFLETPILDSELKILLAKTSYFLLYIYHID